MKSLKKISVMLFVMVFALSVNASAYTMYALDGRQANIDYADADAWRSVGWYDAPVTLMYAPDGRTAVVYKSDVPAWEKVGWYDGNKTVTIYAPDGRTAQIPASQLQAYKNVGWYDYPVAGNSSGSQSSGSTPTVACYPGTNVPKYEAVTGIRPSSSGYGCYDYAYVDGRQDKDAAYINYLKNNGFREDKSYVDGFWNGIAANPTGLSVGWLPVGRYVKGYSSVRIDYNRMTGALSIEPK